MKVKNIFTFLLTFSILLIFNENIIAQPNIEWEKNYGGSGFDKAFAMAKTNDNGVIVAGYAETNDGDVIGNYGKTDYWILKLNHAGEIEWQKNYGGSESESARSIEQTDDGGYIIAGSSSSNNGDVGGNYGKADYWVLKLDIDRNIEWQKNYGGSESETCQSIKQTTDGGYIVAGWSDSNDGDIVGAYGDSDYWILKLNSSGNIVWKKNYGGSGPDRAYSAEETSDGGYIVTGHSRSSGGDITMPKGFWDHWVLKLSSNGNLEWKKNLGGSEWDNSYSIEQTSDNGYIVAGFSQSSNGDVGGNNGGLDYWIIKLNNSGGIEWEKNYGGSEIETAYSIKQTDDGGYIVAGRADVNTNGIIHSNLGILKLDISGNLQWEQDFGGSETDNAFSVLQTSDGGYVAAGYSYSSDGDVGGNNGEEDFWIVKLESSDCSSSIQNIPQVNVQQSDVYIEDACYGIILTAPDGSCYRVTVEVGGALVTEAVDCP